MATAPRRPRLGVFKFSSCDGCQLSILDLEDELLALTAEVEVAYFLEAATNPKGGRYDVALVEGSIATEEDVERIKGIRRRSRHLIAIGACATAGGIQALRNFGDLQDFASGVYPRPQQLRVLATSTPISEHVKVDLELQGCPVDRRQLLDVVLALLHHRRAVVPGHSVCVECKLRGNECVVVAAGIPCLGPITRAGCGAICPAYGRGCYGCFGPSETFNAKSLIERWRQLGDRRPDVVSRLRHINAWAAPVRTASTNEESHA
jgi:coenzyme F420-reducing hydrogenase gamma subunit